jgi:hypothetical protein
MKNKKNALLEIKVALEKFEEFLQKGHSFEEIKNQEWFKTFKNFDKKIKKEALSFNGATFFQGLIMPALIDEGLWHTLQDDLWESCTLLLEEVYLQEEVPAL